MTELHDTETRIDSAAIENVWRVNESDGTLFGRDAPTANQSTYSQAQSAFVNPDGRLFLCTRRTMP